MDLHSIKWRRRGEAGEGYTPSCFLLHAWGSCRRLLLYQYSFKGEGRGGGRVVLPVASMWAIRDLSVTLKTFRGLLHAVTFGCVRDLHGCCRNKWRRCLSSWGLSWGCHFSSADATVQIKKVNAVFICGVQQ